MATIHELVEKHSKVPGDIKVRGSTWSEGSWFQPYYLLQEYYYGPHKSQYGFAPESTGSSYSHMVEDWELYVAPRPKVKRAQYLIIPKTSSGFPMTTHEWFEDLEDFESYYGTKYSKTIRLEEREFDE